MRRGDERSKRKFRKSARGVEEEIREVEIRDCGRGERAE
jgi:hypothetical protein